MADAAVQPARKLLPELPTPPPVPSFFRLTSPTVIAQLREAFPDLPDAPDQRTVFLKLRELRNSS